MPADVLESLDVRPMTDVAEIVALALQPADAGTAAALADRQRKRRGPPCEAGFCVSAPLFSRT